MRCAHVLAVSLTMVVVANGCRNQATPLTNPFLTPDRVPPPSTRVLTPGTAQPYYPGDPLPGAAPITGLPPTTAAPPAASYAPPTYSPYSPTTAPPATAYPSGPAYPMGPPTQGPTAQPAPTTAPPANWNTYPSSAQNSRPGDAVAVPDDGQQLRFAAAPTATPAFTPNAGAQSPVQQAAFNAPTAQRPQAREVTPAEYVSQPNTISGISSPPSRDGFRPQGSEPREEAKTEPPVSKGFRSPALARSAVTAAGAATDRFGVGSRQEWLRGQLEYWPQSSEWSIRYMPDGQVDQIGGRILIDNPQVLGNLSPGEMVMVEGQVFGRQIDEASWRPAYRVAVVQRQRP